MEWKEQALHLYFNEHLRISEVAEKVGKSRQSVSALLKSSELFETEKSLRKQESAKRRKRQQFLWDKKNRSPLNVSADGIDVVYEGVKREHRMATAELSRERYH